MRRQLIAETATAQGKTVIQLLWDIAAFFDSIDITELIKHAKKWSMPYEPTILALQQHLAPRALQIGGCFAPLIEKTGLSILAGCTSSTRFGRAILRDSALETIKGAAKAVGSHVDDVTQLFTGANKWAVKRDAEEQGIGFAQALQKAGFTISVKSVVVSSCWETAKSLVRTFQSNGIPMKAVGSAEDIGVTATGGCKRIVKENRQRLNKGIKRAGRVRVLTKFNAKAKVLYKTGVKPQQLYGIHSMGAAPSQRRTARRAAVMCGGCVGWRPCYTTALRQQCGAEGDPGVELPVQQVSHWLDLWWEATVEEKEDYKISWRILRDKLSCRKTSDGRKSLGQWQRLSSPCWNWGGIPSSPIVGLPLAKGKQRHGAHLKKSRRSYNA